MPRIGDGISPTGRRVRRTMAPGAALLLLAFAAGCVAVREVELKPPPGNVPPGMADLWIAVPGSGLRDPAALALEVEGVGRCYLRAGALNRLFLPPGPRSLRLPGLRQEGDNARIRHVFEEGRTLRLILLSRPGPDSTRAAPGVALRGRRIYRLTPITRDGLADLQSNSPLPWVTLSTK